MRVKSSRRAETYAGWAVAWAAASLLAGTAAMGKPLGSNADEALFVILARRLREGSFSVPGPLGWTVTDPWPGFPALLALPQAALGAHWFAYRLLGLGVWCAFAFAAYKLARRFASPGLSAAAALLAALSPAALGQAGQITPDLAFSALVAWSLAEFAAEGPAIAWAAPCVLAELSRPHGALLLCALFAAALIKKRRADAATASVAAIPLALLLLRNRWIAGTVTAYAVHWRAQPPASFGVRLEGLSFILGHGLAGLSAWAGALLAALFAWAVWRWASEDESGTGLAAALFSALVLALHATWTAWAARYAAPLAPLFFAALARRAQGKESRRLLGAVGLAVLAASVVADIRETTAFAAGAIVEPGTMAWIASSTPRDARFESYLCMPIMLFADRQAAVPPPQDLSRDAWLASLLQRRIDYVHVFGLSADGYFPSGARALAPRRESWARGLSYFAPVYQNPREKDAIFHLVFPEPERYLKAWALFASAGELARSGAAPAEVRPRLEQAISADPRLASAWAALGELEPSPRKRLADFERAQEADPTSIEIRRDLAAAQAAGREQP